LRPEAIETVLADFRAWLQELAAKTAAPSPPVEEAEAIDLHTLLAQFVALRHEVNLQTKATRTQQEQNNETLQQLGQALETLRQTQAAARQIDQQAKDEAIRPFLKSLVDVFDALSLAEREVQRVSEVILNALDELTFTAPPVLEPEQKPDPAATSALQPRRSFWARLFGRGPAAEETPAPSPPQLDLVQQEMQTEDDEEVSEEKQQTFDETVERVHHLLDSVLTGYTMSLQRVARALQQAELEPIPCVGKPFDPELMEVVATVADSGRPVGEVVEEVRRGYRWHGRVFRYAQVSVAKS
jgi:molecular chaperone GrpE